MSGFDDLPTFACPRVSAPFALDGDLSKAPWRGIAPAWLQPADGRLPPPLPDPAAFFAAGLLPDNADGAPQLTAFAACWSDDALYLAFRCRDRDIWGTCTRRDDPLYDEEVVEAFLAPTGDVRRYYEFEVSPRAVLFDAAVHSPDRVRATMRVDTAWDCPGLHAAVRVNGTLHPAPPAARREDGAPSEGWCVEVAIPFAAFPKAGAPRPGDVWRANFYRIDRADPPEFTAWSPTLEDPPNFHVPVRFGRLRFVE